MILIHQEDDTSLKSNPDFRDVAFRRVVVAAQVAVLVVLADFLLFPESASSALG